MQTRGPMCTTIKKKDRLMEIFFRAMKGERLSIKRLAQEYGVSTKSVSRDMNEIKNFLSDSRDLVGNAECSLNKKQSIFPKQIKTAVNLTIHKISNNNAVTTSMTALYILSNECWPDWWLCKTRIFVRQ